MKSNFLRQSALSYFLVFAVFENEISMHFYK